MTTERGHALRWQCPECGARLRSEALDRGTATDLLAELVREHLAAVHQAPDVNARAQVSWLAPAGHHVTLWGGPHDGAQLWLPPGELPELLGVQRGQDGQLYPLRSSLARMLPAVETYRLNPDLPGVRYLFERWTS